MLYKSGVRAVKAMTDTAQVSIIDKTTTLILPSLFELC